MGPRGLRLRPPAPIAAPTSPTEPQHTATSNPRPQCLAATRNPCTYRRETKGVGLWVPGYLLLKLVVGYSAASRRL